MLGSSMTFEILLILALILINGVFAMSEIAVVSSRKSRLQQRASEGDAGARRALELAEDPTRFLSTVQIGITLVGVFAGAFGGASIAGRLDNYLEGFPAMAPYSEGVALFAVVAAITFLSLVVGELVPKRIALNRPERIAGLVAAPMHGLSIVASPFVRVLSVSTEGLLKLLRVRKAEEPPVTEEEVSALLDVGMAAGVFEEEEHDLVERVFWLADQRVGSLVTPRQRIEWLDVRDAPEAHRSELVRHRFSHYLVCDGEVDRVLGMVRVKDLLAELLEGRPLDPRAALRQPLFVPSSLRALRLLTMFRESGIHLAVVIDEYGGVEGLVTLNDVLEEITGDLGLDTEPRVVQREDGSWLVDASLTMDEFWVSLNLEEPRVPGGRAYHTLGGLVVTELGRIPHTGDTFELHDLKFEVVDMDGHRVDKVLVGRSGVRTGEAMDMA
jgi:putative hemolysin